MILHIDIKVRYSLVIMLGFKHSSIYQFLYVAFKIEDYLIRPFRSLLHLFVNFVFLSILGIYCAL